MESLQSTASTESADWAEGAESSAARRGTAPDRGEQPDLVTVPARQGLEAVDILRRVAAPSVGPVLHDDASDTLGFLVPPGTADGWDMPGSACTQTSGRGLRLPAASRAEGADWLLPPDDTGPVTDPAVLRRALGEAARLIEAADNCR
ncbi:hypothetical protein [Streptomyces sp. PR69]|uniref:hypothetical protein n=1 Tax=Streptomyces sp. PR69 TaxID=2984950 RepID=UPI00226483A5|nr:hypothetical protein [Streptomyces sp. PR69]